MSKRFTETEKWRDPWFRKLPPEHKLLWIYVLDNCDSSGVWDPDIELVAIFVGCPLERVSKGLANLSERVSILPCGKWHVRRFVEFQYGKLSPDCKPHQSVIKTMKRHGIELFSKEMNSKNPKGLAKGMDTLEDKEKDKDKEKERQAGSRKPLLPEIPETLAQIPGFPEIWADWITARSQARKPLTPKAAEQQFVLLSANHAEAVEMVRKSINSSWTGIFPLKNGPSQSAANPPLGKYRMV